MGSSAQDDLGGVDSPRALSKDTTQILLSSGFGPRLVKNQDDVGSNESKLYRTP